MPRSGDGIVNNLGEALYCGDFASCALVKPLFIHGGVVKPLFSLAYGVATPSSTVVRVTYGRPHDFSGAPHACLVLNGVVPRWLAVLVTSKARTVEKDWIVIYISFVGPFV
jgi:hypothetical protein